MGLTSAQNSIKEKKVSKIECVEQYIKRGAKESFTSNCEAFFSCSAMKAIIMYFESFVPQFIYEALSKHYFYHDHRYDKIFTLLFKIFSILFEKFQFFLLC